MIRSLGAVILATIDQQRHSLGVWVLTILSVVAILFQAIWGTRISIEVLHGAVTILLLVATPLVVGNGMIFGEVARRRVLIFHGHGTSRSAFVLGRILGTVVTCMIVPAAMQIALIGSELVNHCDVSLAATITFLFRAFVYLCYMSTLLAFLSMFFTGASNSLVAAGLNFFYLLVVVPRSELLGANAEAILRVVRVFSMGPIHSVVFPNVRGRSETIDILISLLMIALIGGFSVLRYKRAELALWMRRTG